MTHRTNDDNNPYAVNTLQERATILHPADVPVAEHTDFELLDDGIITRSGLRLPAWCLKSANEKSLKPVTLKFVDTDPPQIGRGASIARVLVNISVAAILSIAAFPIFRSGNLVGTIVISLLGCLWPLLPFFSRWLRNQPPQNICKVNGFVSRSRIRFLYSLFFVFSVPYVIAIFVAFFSFTTAPGASAPSHLSTVAALFVALGPILLILVLIALPKVRLKCRKLPAGRFHITGFTRKYMQRLRQEYRN